MKKRRYIVGEDEYYTDLYDDSTLMFHELMYSIDNYNLQKSEIDEALEEFTPSDRSLIHFYDEDVINRSVFSELDGISTIAI